MSAAVKKSVQHSGMAAIVGRPNVGKSTLLNALVGEKIAIVSKVPQTTRNQVRGIYGDERGQIVFVDTPGLHRVKDRLDQFMKSTAMGSLNDTDVIIHLVDAMDSVGADEEELVRRLAALEIPVIVGFNKVDKGDRCIPEYIGLWERMSGKKITELKNVVIVPLSGKSGLNLDKLLDLLFERLPPGPPLYPQDTVCDIPQRMVMADIIREKLLNVMREEVPHSLAVIIESIEPRRKKTQHINALILVEKDSHKSIVIGKSGSVLKKIGTLARTELEDLLESRVYLEIHVKVKKDWRDNIEYLQQMGYDSI